LKTLLKMLVITNIFSNRFVVTIILGKTSFEFSGNDSRKTGNINSIKAADLCGAGIQTFPYRPWRGLWPRRYRSLFP